MGIATKMSAPTMRIPTYTAGLPTGICPGGIKLKQKAVRLLSKPTPATTHMPKLPPGTRKVRGTCGSLWRR